MWEQRGLPGQEMEHITPRPTFEDRNRGHVASPNFAEIAPGAEFGWVRNLSNFVCPIKKMALSEEYGHQQFSYRWFYSHPKSVAPEAHIEAS